MSSPAPFEQLADLPPAEIAAALEALDGDRAFTICRRDLDVWIQHGKYISRAEIIEDLELIIAGFRDGRIRPAPTPDPTREE